MDYRILDCTLRDGGYYTNWDFDGALVETYFRALAALPVALVEVGYCNPPLDGYKGQWFYLGKERLERVRASLREDQQLAIMLDAKSCTVDDLAPMLGPLSGIVDMVRMAVGPDQFGHGIALARELKRLGFAVGFNTMYLSTYAEDLAELRPLIEAQDAIDILALVDSYGGCMPAGVASAVAGARALFAETPVGFHGHDNTCLAQANALAAIEAGAAVVDSTFTGMGRGAGNTRTEMMLVHKSTQGVAVDFDAVAEVTDAFEKLQRQHRWGTSLPYMLSGAANLPQKDVMTWLGKNRYSPISVVRALNEQSDGQIDQAAYQDLGPQDMPESAGAAVVIVGGGGSVRDHRDAIGGFCRESGALVIHANTRHLALVGTFGVHELVCLPGHAAHALPHDSVPDALRGFVVPRPPRFRGSVPEDLPRCVYQAGAFPPGADGVQIGPVSDIGPLALAVGAARALQAERIYLVGFDGYDNAGIAEQELVREIQETIDRVQAEGEQEVVSLTPTRYKVAQRSVYSELAYLARRAAS